jgi:hypothetical protein
MISRRSLAGSCGLRVAPRVLGDAVDKFKPVVDVELLIDVAGTVPDGASGDEELLFDLLVAGSLKNQTQDLPLPRGWVVGFDDPTWPKP